mmetsp:Transcript_14975/g.30890  ORF Transcript_14975/g.30890 Transcript_14975/m.30890 type:complete len:166 (+) Transcript_14975:120-617(+)|eukprot:CAMPEP_0201119456 /NCGR_PEP_ID=MMETSP0850-20130426/3602_1 /ASSEMBLY_ACC=CAM_ASM_000622 /TAXON_ID=183588 /ORGANISM="Pseudo-nitzschia fraudulenta, Strain WWA7" /LENGTH=165 /DNA_ID=CAMNT_0047385171 /DNA_START=99 /DNA_END=596 /DNA_ORIENTATION=-
METYRDILFSLFLWMAVSLSSNAAFFVDAASAPGGVVVETLSKESSGPSVPVTRDHRYRSDVTLYIEGDNGERTPSGWSTRVEDGAAREQPFAFRPGVNLIEGWTMGVLEMEEGERALLHVPSALGYGPRAMGSKGGAFFIPANSNLLFDIKILGKEGEKEPTEL